MILKIEQDISLIDFEIIVKYPLMNKTIEKIISYIKATDTQIKCRSKESIKRINVSDIYYVESKDKKTEIFCEDESYETDFRLYQLYEKLSSLGFVQISKYCVLNMNKVDKFKPLLNSRMEAILTNEKHLYINRNYISDIKKRFQND